MEWIWLKGVLLGLSIAIPLGPIGILCIRRSLSGGFWHGFYTGIGTASADALYGIAAAFGFAALHRFILLSQIWLQGLGGLFLLYLANQIFRSHTPDIDGRRTDDSNYRHAAASSFALTLTNPMTILSFAALFASVGIIEAENLSVTLSFVFGIFSGSLLWWLLLSSLAAWSRQCLTARSLQNLQYLAAVVIAAFGTAALWSFARQI
ncbi:LysE family translocator [Azotosporobacter soli]|uniref:LysE family translocator n=1 Tax=Azotosporobacter soli TaxID=3055040 RepID=UPI0031FF27F7